MQSERAIALLTRQREGIEALRSVSSSGPEFSKWRRDTEIVIAKIFGDTSRNVSDFTGISYSLSFFTSGTPDHAFHEAYLRGLAEAKAVIESMIDEITEFAIDHGSDENGAFSGMPDHLSLIERICLRFHSAARQLQSRHAGRTTIEIEDEYDVQDLLHGLLRLHFEDIRPEEWTPSYAGRAARVDFLLKPERIVIEVKKTRASLKAGDIGEQLIIDCARYERHPDCDTLVCFVYDPEGRIGNPAGIERDLGDHQGRLMVRVIIAPKR